MAVTYSANYDTGQSWAVDNSSLLRLSISNTEGQSIDVTSITCQIGSGKGSVCFVAGSTVYYGNGNPVIADLYTGDEWSANGGRISAASAYTAVNVVLAQGKDYGTYFYDVGSNGSYNVTFNFDYVVTIPSNQTYYFWVKKGYMG